MLDVSAPRRKTLIGNFAKSQKAIINGEKRRPERKDADDG
jgi:hypothetical protein